MVASPLWRGPGNIHGLPLGGKSYRQGLVTSFKTTTLSIFLAYVENVIELTNRQIKKLNGLQGTLQKWKELLF